jgi:folate-binding protein YgfZ
MDLLPLHSTHAELGARFGERRGKQVVSDYRAPLEEYEAARKDAVLVDLSFREALRITGDDRLSFFHGMCTQDIKGLPEWGAAYLTMVTVKGAMVSDGRAVRRPDDLIVDLEPGTFEAVRDFLDQYLISEDAELHDAREEFGVLGVLGPRTAEVLRLAFGMEVAAGSTLPFEGAALAVLPSLLTRGPGLDLLLPRQKLESLWWHLQSAGSGCGLRAAGAESLEWVRVEDGVPRFGQDLLESTIPLEADLTHAIHYQKGCYVGQEIIARATYRGQMNKKLAGLLFGNDAPAVGTALQLEGKKVGFVTSVVHSPAQDQYVGLGYVHRDHLAEGTSLQVADGGAQAIVSPLPMRSVIRDIP